MFVGEDEPSPQCLTANAKTCVAANHLTACGYSPPPTTQFFLTKDEQRRPRSLIDLNRAWYGHHNPHPTHCCSCRCRGLNYHNVWHQKPEELLYFNRTLHSANLHSTLYALHAGKVKADIQFSPALAAKTLRAHSASSKRRDFNPATPRYDFRVFLLGLGLIGDEFKTARHIMANLAGSAAWKHGRPAQHAAA